MFKDQARSKPTGLPIIHPFAAGIDIGSRFHVVAVSSELCNEPVQTFEAFTADLQRMAAWLVALGIKKVFAASRNANSRRRPTRTTNCRWQITG